ncbi:HD domain-containing protein [Hyperthermus butylicus]|uniref:Universally conserved protein n=1 Tax=Hyperthermus butylicus (strain DSM 5456 / JCM 9403 / PLM1-5) TaxID=415426 RepID=A2BKW7_HYPBU|nr:HD domain-containing protein [Hyperthermus butylicus]ABM80628.1 universally conserved protein [Hyperthermus butylicus DSM 5456]
MDWCTPIKSFKDPVHGYVDLCGKLVPVVDSWVMQRLRGIRQTGFAYLVYHGMEHSRFNHSLGAAHLAKEALVFLAGNTRTHYRGVGGEEFANTLLRSIEVFQLAALVHDIGHLPFSHASESGIVEARRVFQVSEFEGIPLRHEEYTYSLIPAVAEMASASGVEPVFTNSLSKDLFLILRGRGAGLAPRDYTSECASHVLHQLIAGGLDVDRMDYLLRDSIYAGVRYGIFDVDRLIRVLIASPLLLAESEDLSGVRVSESACQVAVLDKGLSILETFLLARFYMFSEVYLHRVVEAYNAVYARLMGVLARDGLLCPGLQGCEVDIPRPPELEESKPEAIQAWGMLDDNMVLSLMKKIVAGRVKASSEARKLAAMIVERRHPKHYTYYESREAWGIYSNYLEKGLAEDWAKPLLEELVEMQRENPLLIIRPLRVHVASFEKINIYERNSGRLVDVKDAMQAEEYSRFGKLAQLGMHRIAVFTTPENGAAARKAIDLIKALDEEAKKRRKA